MSAATAVTVAVVAFNSATVLEACLVALGRHAPLVVIDNASPDGSAALAARLAPHARVLPLPRNVGFGAAANRAFADAATPFGLLLNADVVLAPGAIEALIAAARRYPEAALLAPALRTPAGALRFGRATFLRPARRSAAPAPPLPEGDCCAWYVGGAAMLLRLDAFRAAGGFDESLFLTAASASPRMSHAACRRRRRRRSPTGSPAGTGIGVTPRARPARSPFSPGSGRATSGSGRRARDVGLGTGR